MTKGLPWKYVRYKYVFFNAINSTITGAKNIACYLCCATNPGRRGAARCRKLHQTESKIDILRMDL